ncbi:MAG: cytochrome c [Saprospiraceae bacterium]
MKISLAISSLLGMFLLLSMVTNTPAKQWNSEDNLYDVLFALGEAKPKHYLQGTPEQIKQGEEIIKEGRTHRMGKRSRRVSKYYMCTTCHNVEQEDPDLTVSDPETRLPYVKAKGIPFLQGSTFKGIVNRESWYNDDYVKKYGEEKIGEAHEDLRNAIQLCAVECAQGRKMKDWEVESVLAYYWSLQFTLGDLNLSSEEMTELNQAMVQRGDTRKTLNWLKSKYAQKSAATFFDPPPSKHTGYEGLAGDPARGKDIYELSCLFCHQPGGVSHYLLDDKKQSFQHLKSKITKDTHFSLYQIIAYGTYAIPGHKPYMPHYPLERMSKQQVEDLRAYIEQQAK